jgi:hypothetical protein
MAATIDSTNISNIDEEYPVAGQDNDSQGFRDNFNAIKTALEQTDTDVNDLYNTTAKLNQDNVFYDTENDEPVVISGANFKEVTEYVNVGTDSIKASGAVNFTDGHYHVLTVDAASLNLILSAWPSSGRVAKMTVQLSLDPNGSSSSCDITFTSEGGATIQSEVGFTNPVTINSSVNQKIFEFWTYNGGNTIFARYLGEYS